MSDVNTASVDIRARFILLEPLEEISDWSVDWTVSNRSNIVMLTYPALHGIDPPGHLI